VYKIRNKKFALLLTIVFVLTIMMPLATPASAATTYDKLTTPTVVPASPAANAVLGTITIKIDTLGVGTHTALVSLPADFVAAAVPPVLAVAKATQVGGATTPAVTTAGFAANEFRIDVVQTVNPATDVLLTLTLPGVTVPSDAEGDIVATITGLGGQLTGGSVVVGKASSGAVTVSLVDTVTLTENGLAAPGLQITLSENAASAVKKVAGSVKFTLPKGYTWDTAGATAVRVNDGTNLLTVAPVWTLAGTGTRTLSVDRGADVIGKSIFRLGVGIAVDETEAKLGDVSVTVSGSSSVSPSSLTIGSYKEYGVTVAAKSVEEVIAGRYAQEIGKIEMKEAITDSLYYGRAITLELPAGCKWANIPAPKIEGGIAAIAIGAANVVGTDGRKIKFSPADAAGGKGTITFEDLEIDVAADFSGDIKVKIDGTAGAVGEVLVAKAVAPIKATAEKPTVKIGVQGQEAGTITLVEGAAETFKRGKDLVLTAPLNVHWTSDPTVTVTEGDLEFDLKAVQRNGRVLTIPVKADSVVASTVTISNIKFTIDRTVPEGPVKIAIAGNALDEVNDILLVPAELAARAVNFYPIVGVTQIFPKNDVVAAVVNATVGTPAPGDSMMAASFVIGAKTYTLNGVEATMDVVPYVKDGRTYLPVRYVGYALGVAPENILWDGKTATLVKGDKVVQVSVGSKAMIVNGATINLDVAPELKDGRTMLPFRWIAWAFGAAVDWDAATQTVTMNL